MRLFAVLHVFRAECLFALRTYVFRANTMKDELSSVNT